MKVSLITVNYHSRKALKQALTSVNWAGISHEVIVVDNDRRNIGYGAGLNRGALRARGQYLLLTNPDVIFDPQAVKLMVRFLDRRKDTAAVGPNLPATGHLGPPEGLVALGVINKYFPGNPVSAGYFLPPQNRITYPQTLHGCCFMIRRAVFEKLGGFDPRFFLYFEENDFFLRLRQAGGKAARLPRVKIIHLGQVSSRGQGNPEIFARSRRAYFDKHYGRWWALVIEVVVG